MKKESDMQVEKQTHTNNRFVTDKQAQRNVWRAKTCHKTIYDFRSVLWVVAAVTNNILITAFSSAATSVTRATNILLSLCLQAIIVALTSSTEYFVCMLRCE